MWRFYARTAGWAGGRAAFKDFGADDNSTTKSIVVITDGDNFQFNLSGRPGGDGGNPTSIDDVMRAWESAKIPLFILGVGISDSETPNARKTLQSLAQRTQGKYYDIENGSDLLRALLEQLATADYQVKLDSSADLQLPSPPVESKLNSQVEIKNIALATSRYQVLFQSISKPIQLAGGESLEMFVREDGQDIFAKPYEPLSPKATLIRPNSNELIARVHRPLLERNGVVFPISLQDPGSHFTPRPDQVWIEVVPVLASGKTMPRTYVFYDTHYEPGKPVPLLAWHASDWPANATQADVRVWAKNEASVELQSIPLNQLTQDAAGFAKGIPVNGVEGITLRGQLAENLGASNAMQIQITELHGERSRGVGSIRIVLDAGGNSLPTRITRRFDSESRMAIHTFEFESAMGRTLLASSRARLVITSREATLEGAWQSQGGQPIRVGVTNPPEVLPLEAAIGLR